MNGNSCTDSWSKDSEAATGGVMLKKMFLKFLQNSQENSCVGVSFLINLQAWCLQPY